MKFILLSILFTSVSGIRISCSFNNDNDYIGLGRVYACVMTSLDVSDDPIMVTGIIGGHFNGNSDSDVQLMMFGSNCDQYSLSNVPKGLLSYFPNLIAIGFFSCSINTLNGDELNEYSNLQWFSLNYSNLTRVPSNLFSSTSNLQYVNLGYNLIENVGVGLLSSLQNLQSVRFLENPCINQQALTAADIATLIDALQQNCPDIATTTQTTSTASTISSILTTISPTCLILQAQLGSLITQNEALAEKFENITSTLSSQAASLEQITEELNQKKAELTQLNVELENLKQTC